MSVLSRDVLLFGALCGLFAFVYQLTTCIVRSRYPGAGSLTEYLAAGTFFLIQIVEALGSATLCLFNPRLRRFVSLFSLSLALVTMWHDP